MDYTAIGDTVNLASRMEGIARPGTVVVSAHTHKLASSFFEFRSLGRVPVKGKKEPQQAYELVGPGEVETRIEASAAKGLTRFVGRTKEIKALREAFEEARSGSGQVVGIKGEAGVGKSRLLMEFRNTLPEAEHVYLEGTCQHYGASMVYLPILGILRSYFGIRVGDQEEDVQKKVREILARLDGRLPGAQTPLQDVLSLTINDEAYLQIDPQQRRQRVFESIRDLLISATEPGPLVLAIEDLHWVDKTSQAFLDFFTEGLSAARILLLLLYRREYEHPLNGRPYCREIPLDQLSTDTGTDLVQAILKGGEVTPELGSLILGRSGGNPLFVEELTNNLLEMEEAKGYYDKAMELLDTLSDTGPNRERKISLLVNQSNVMVLLLKFREYHDLLVHHESMAAGLDNRGLSGAFYARLGWSEAIFGHSDRAIETLTEAARLCETAGNVEEAGFAVFFLAFIHVMKSDYDRVFELKDDLLRKMETSFTLRCYVRGLSSASQACAQLGRWDEAVSIGERALRVAGDYSDISMTAFAEVNLSAVYTYKRELDRAVAYAEQALARAATPMDKLMAQQFFAWALCHAGEPHEGIEILVGILPLYQAAGFVMNELWCTSSLAEGYWQAGEVDKGRQTAEELLKIAERCGARYCTGYAHFLLGEMSLRTEPDRAATHFEKSIAVFQEIVTVPDEQDDRCPTHQKEDAASIGRYGF